MKVGINEIFDSVARRHNITVDELKSIIVICIKCGYGGIVAKQFPDGKPSPEEYVSKCMIFGRNMVEEKLDFFVGLAKGDIIE